MMMCHNGNFVSAAQRGRFSNTLLTPDLKAVVIHLFYSQNIFHITQKIGQNDLFFAILELSIPLHKIQED